MDDVTITNFAGSMEPVLPELNNIEQEITRVCENGHRHYLDLLMSATSIRLEEREICILSTHLNADLLHPGCATRTNQDRKGAR